MKIHSIQDADFQNGTRQGQRSISLPGWLAIRDDPNRLGQSSLKPGGDQRAVL